VILTAAKVGRRLRRAYLIDVDFSIIFKDEAETDIAEIINYYQRQSEGLGLRFLDDVERCLQKLIKNPYHTFNLANNIRRIVTQSFPYNIYYMVLENEIIIFAVLH
jgi:plasmid stabilization system protein ParE